MRNKIKRILAAVMAAGMTLSVIPSITTYAAQTGQNIVPVVTVALMSNSLVRPFASIHTSAGSTYSLLCAA